MAGVGGRDPARYEQRRASEPVRPLVFVGRRTARRVAARSRGGRLGARRSDPHHDPREPRIADGRGVRRYRRGGGGGGGLAPFWCCPPLVFPSRVGRGAGWGRGGDLGGARFI